MNEILERIVAERAQQDEQWGGPSHDDLHDLGDWTELIMQFCERADEDITDWNHPGYRDKMIKIAALAVAAIQSLERRAGGYV